MQQIKVDKIQCKKIGEIVKTLNFRPDFYNRKFLKLKADKEILPETSCYVLNKKRAVQYKIPACPAMGDCEIYSLNSTAKTYCMDQITTAGVDTSKLLDIRASEVFYIEETKLVKSTCGALETNVAILTTPVTP